jgi:hypothetical protein
MKNAGLEILAKYRTEWEAHRIHDNISKKIVLIKIESIFFKKIKKTIAIWFFI